jgi:ribokinase
MNPDPPHPQPAAAPGRVVVVGSLNVDLVVGLQRMPAPGETVMGETLERHPGGKGLNQAVAAARLGARVSMIGAVGSDDSGAWLQGIVEAEGIDATSLVTADGPSGTALIEVDSTGMNRIVVIPGANGALTADHVTAAINSLEDVAVVLAQGEVPLEAIAAAMAAGRARGARTILNPAPVRDYPGSLLALVDFLVPNEHEAAHLSGLPTESLVDANEAAQHFTGRGVPHAIITRGARGAVWVSPSSSGSVAAYRVSPVDTVAAGDAFCGGLAAALASGEPLPDALRWASAAGALATTIAGAVPSLPTRDAVEQLLAGE